MGNYDIPAVIEYILNQTGQPKLIYVGHSLGSAMFFIAMINNPELNDKIHVMIGLAPASSMAFFKNYLRLLSPFVDQIAVRTNHSYFLSKICQFSGQNSSNISMSLIKYRVEPIVDQ